jgi:hypothetical protein
MTAWRVEELARADERLLRRVEDSVKLDEKQIVELLAKPDERLARKAKELARADASWPG